MRRVAIAMGVAALAGWASHAGAQAYPERPVRLISPYAPGGSNDIVTRLVGRRLGEALRAPVVVENRPGGGMLIATEMVARAPADGHTLLLASSGHAINPSLRKDLPYDTLRDFAAVALVGWMPNVVVVHPGLPVRTVEDLVAHARRSGAPLNYSSAGNGSTPHLATEWFKSVAGVDLTHVPYKGTGPSLTDLMSGHVALTICGIAPALPYIRSGKLRAIAVTGAARTPLAPELPTVAERGYPGFDVVTWYGVLAPAGTPALVVGMLAKTLATALRTADMAAQFAAQGIDPQGGGPEAFAAFIRLDMQRWAKVVSMAGVRVD